MFSTDTTCFAFSESAGDAPLVAVLYAYFDESGKFQTKDVVAFGGMVADLETLATFDKVWRRELRRVALPCLKMSDAVRNNTPLSERVPAQSVSERIRVLQPFIGAIRDHSELVLGLALDVPAFNEMKKADRGFLGSIDDPHYVVFLRTVAKLARHCGDRNFVSLICDDEEQTAEHCYRYYRRIKKIDPANGKRLACIGFGDDELFPALQAADMIASLARLYAEKAFFKRSYDYRDLLDPFETSNNLFFGFYDREKLQDLLTTSEELRDVPPPYRLS